MAPHADRKQANPKSNSDMVKPFKQRRSFETRKLEAENIRKKFPNKVPVVVERYQREVNLPLIDKTRFLVPLELTIMNFGLIIKNRIRVPSSRAFYFVVNNQSLACTSKTIAEIYKEHRDEDGFLYMTYASQEMFGSHHCLVSLDWLLFIFILLLLLLCSATVIIESF